ncbi:aspartyl/asparaginyl beta-hydroxylase domain-containing protein [Rhodanobacter ginsengisoli]|uniref:Aspartyl/asparaginyl beta-hydroxylase domain-containing protein n=1 Tax=Rhodanobacter ginsengisoli TaxID=418646 RepID=A0ABW0QI37_9GAMM
MNNLQQATPETCRSMAMEHLRRGEADLAEQCFARLHGIAPDDVQALQFLADRHLARNDHAQAIKLLRDADRVKPEDPAVLSQLGSVQLAAGDFSAAAVSLGSALARTPQAFITRLQLGIALEQLGRAHEALQAYFTAVRTAQMKGRWLDDATTAPVLRDVVKYAMNYANEGRKRLFNEVLDPLRQRYGRSELTRVEHALAIYLGEQPKSIPDQRQKPKFLYFPDIPSQPFYPRERFPWLEALEAATGAVREELRAVLSEDRQLEPFLGVQSPEDAREMLRSSSDRTAAWDAYFFYRHGKRYDAHCAACPQTTSLLDTLPLVRIRDHAPETLFSVLSPGAHILPHTGVTNTRLVTHLPLIVPPDCAIRVGGEDHVWREGHCVTFDDTFEHEAWNRSGETRVVLILDSWNPDLSEAECLAVTDLVEAIGDFNQASEAASESPTPA